MYHKVQVVTNVISIYSANFLYSDDNNDFSLNVVKYSLWFVEWDSWYLNSGCWFSFFSSRVFTEVSHHWWGPWSDEICCSKAFLSFFWSPFLAFLAPKGVYIACFILVPFSLYLVCGECAQHWERRVQHWQRLNFWEFGLTNFFHLNIYGFLFTLWAGQSVVCPSWFPCLGGYV